ncbi:hypothetical protein PYH59_10065 [Mammaliicoccus lentus]|uniref:hypothetical protein n=1 Tax=Mammaliicoccus lentus TaxID=42858 RepID=UPI0024A8808F|nr:hypothetical protein [Mammaliicoccus lentus]WHI54181.1 hypothetical protein PYH59_10065 [Mammaliicoccus lentus]
MKSYKRKQIIKHALIHYMNREGAIKSDLNTEKLVLRDIERDIVLMKDEYGIPMTDRDKQIWEEMKL